MKFAKENKIVLICAGVALLFLIFAFAPIPYAVPSLRADLVQDMQTRYDDVGAIKKDANEALVLPGVPPQKGVPSQSWVDARRSMIANINNQQKQVEKDAQDGNAKGRVDLSDPNHPVPILPLPTSADLSRAGLKVPFFLPKIIQNRGDAMGFKGNYGQQFRVWTALLATGAMPPSTQTDVDEGATLPPKPDKLKTEWDAKEAARIAALPPTAGMAGGMGNVNTAQSQRDFWDFEKQRVMNRATSLHMYIEPTAFQRRPWLALDDPPNESQIFDALVDSWLQSDLVKAILTVNTQGSPPKYDVGKAPVKRLVRVMIGNNARTRFLTGGPTNAAAAAGAAPSDPGPLFLTSTNAQSTGMDTTTRIPVSVAGSDAGVASTQATGVQLPAVANATDFTLGMTGRSAGQTYDVAYMSVVMDIDPAALYKFIDQFYRQNMGYTVVNFQSHTVDPLESASNGYLYGDGQVVEVEILFECILFRSWTVPLMPDAKKTDLGGV